MQPRHNYQGQTDQAHVGYYIDDRYIIGQGSLSQKALDEFPAKANSCTYTVETGIMDVIPRSGQMTLKGGCYYRRYGPQPNRQADEQTRSAVNFRWREVPKVGNQRQLGETDTSSEEKGSRVLRL